MIRIRPFVGVSVSVFSLFALLISAIFSFVGGMLDMKNHRADWLYEAKYGVFFHYLCGRDTAGFDTDAFVAEVLETGAGYVVFTLGQNSGEYCAPNPIYEKYAGCAPNEKCSSRDLPMEIADALAPYGIELMLYLPSNAPANDADAAGGFGVSEKNGNDWAINDALVSRWSEVIREWSVHYGKRCAGWWFDGFYESSGFTAREAEIYRAAVLSGNPDAVIAFNPGVEEFIAPANISCDYTAGEMNEFDAYPCGRFVKGAQWHVLSFLGTFWGKTDVKYESGYMAEYIRKVNSRGGVVTVDMYISPEGALSPVQIAEMERVKAAVRGE